ncbi:MAG: glycosyltransferase family 2 protein [Lachnospiraceae bacterium]|nr:glycosyltransferase family 2 protein [Lachnospiraceae bacterium]
MLQKGNLNKIKISVIVPVYNVEKYIKKCLDSILSQTYKSLEIIVVDDGSTDDSGKICDEYALIDSRIQIIHKENEGIVSARKAGIQRATGEYTTNIDSDDWIESNAYESMVKGLEEHSPDMMIMGYKKEYEGFMEECWGGMEEGLYQSEDFWGAFNNIVSKNAFFCQPVDMSLWNKMIRTELWKKYQLACPDYLKKNVDDAVIYPCLLNMKSIYVEKGFYYHYCVRKNSILWKKQNQDYSYFLNLAEHLILSLKDSSVNNERNRQFLLYKIFYHMILDVPEKLLGPKGCAIYPNMTPDVNIIIYGKGVFAARLEKQIKGMKYCNIIDNVDRTDIERIRSIEEKEFDYIVIAIFNATIVADAIKRIEKIGVSRKKILYMDKNMMSVDMLPYEIRKMWGLLI